MRILFVGTNQSLIFQRWVGWFIENTDYVIGIAGKKMNYQSGALFYDFSFPKGNDTQKTSFNGYFQQILMLKKIIRKFKPDIIHVHSVFLYGILISLATNKKYIVTAWGSDVLYNVKQSFIIRILTSLSLKKASLITVESEYVKKACTSLGAKEEKIYNIQFGIDKIYHSDDFSFLSYKDLKKEIIVFPRGISSLYNISVFIDSLKDVLKNNKNVLFIIKYLNNHQNHQNISKIINELESKNISKENYKIIGELSYQQLINLYSVSKIIVSIPSSDSISISLIEAMRMGAVPIVSDIPANREVVNCNELIIPINSKKLSDTICLILSDYNKYKQKILLKTKELIEKFDRKRNMGKVISIYERFVENGK